MAIKPSAFRYDYLGMDKASIKRSLANRLTYEIGKDLYTAKPRDWYHGLAFAVRDRLIERWMETMRTYYNKDAKRVYYLSLEFLIGRTLTNSLLNMDMAVEVRQALEEIGLDLEELREQEPDAALGNGGLGRLAACFLDSMATLRLPGYGYGIRYEYGMFNQRIEHGRQIEQPENWLRYGNPWEFARPGVLYPVHFYGRVIEFHDDSGRVCYDWTDTEDVMMMAYDTPVPGYHTNTVNNLRLWTAKSTREFDLKYFNEGDYIQAVAEKNESENLTRVLYPNDTTEMGKELRLKQQFCFVSASLQDILRRFLHTHDDLTKLPDKVAIQLNDTHPSIAIPEMMRLLVDIHHLEWNQAREITRNIFSYTNHTLLPEALETWQVDLLGELLPRHLQIIYRMNHEFLEDVRHRYPGDEDRVRRMSMIDEAGERRVRMAHLAIVGSHKVNGVSALHTDLMSSTIFRDFDEHFPGKIINVTNGVTPRRWVNQANPRLSGLISSQIGKGWLQNLMQLEGLIPLVEDEDFRAAFREVKWENKKELADKIKSHLHIDVDPNSMFDVQVKRIHEYKRQLLNVLHIIYLYNRIRSGEELPAISRTIIISGKAAPGYEVAKKIIQLIHDVADVVNNDPLVNGYMRVVFIPNYDVTTATDIIPAADLSEQISTAGTEASGTGNMKLGLNGALTLGTLDGANVEMREAVGEENFFIFGLDREGVDRLHREGYDPKQYYENDTELRRVLDMISHGYFSPGEPERYRSLIESLMSDDRYLLLADFSSYCEVQRKVEALYQNQDSWTRMAIINVARLGRFSSDRAIQEYADKIWNAVPVLHE